MEKNEILKEKAVEILGDIKGDNYKFGIGVLNQLGGGIIKKGQKVSIVVGSLGREWITPQLTLVEKILQDAGIEVITPLIAGARPNAPKEDVYFMASKIKEQKADIVISLGSGSTIDAVKAAIALTSLDNKYPNLDDYYGTSRISEMLSNENKSLIPHFAIMTTASSAAHLTKYSNITDTDTHQKMLIVDDSIVPYKALFDYSSTITQPYSLTVDGAFDGISHSLEVLMGIPANILDKALPVCLTGVNLIVNNIKKVVNDPNDINAREAIGLGTDLGGCAIMIGGTNGAHLNSFSMTDILSHGRACALMNPYYVVFFSNVISDRLKAVASIYKNAGYINEDIEQINGRELGLILAQGMIRLSKDVGFPITFKDVPGYSIEHKRRSLEAAKDPKLESKLKNMPVPMTPNDVDEYMGSVLDAAESGDMRVIKNMKID